jgi:DNA-binding beta-propeller fold protein YncE
VNRHCAAAFLSFGLRLAAPLLALAAPAFAQGGYSIKTQFKLGGDGSWDYLALDTAANRLFVARENRVMVIDAASGKLLGEIPGLNRAHGVAFAYAEGHGFATSGADSTVTMFDLKTLRVITRTKAAEDDDAVLYDPVTKHVFTLNGDAHSSSVLDAETGANIGTVDLGAKPEFGVTALDGMLYANVDDQGQGAVVEIDAAAMRVTRRWSTAPCASATGLAIDVAHHRLFSVCRNTWMAISDTKAGALVATAKIGGGVDAAAFDPATQLAFASNNDGTLTLVHEDAPDKYTVTGTLQTGEAGKTMALDPKTHRVYVAVAKFEVPPAPAGGGRRPRPQMVPGSFVVMVLSR